LIVERRLRHWKTMGDTFWKYIRLDFLACIKHWFKIVKCIIILGFRMWSHMKWRLFKPHWRSSYGWATLQGSLIRSVHFRPTCNCWGRSARDVHFEVLSWNVFSITE
jgi:hypothetical protein